MRYYPVNLDLQGRRVVVVGGGAVAARKARRLLSAGAELVVVSPAIDEALAAIVAGGSAKWLKREYREGDLDGAFLAFAATSDNEVNRQVAAEARREGILFDVVDAPEESLFITPAVLEQGDLLITVSTGGASPSLSRRIVKDLAPQFGAEYAEAVALLRKLREKVLTLKGTNAYNERVFAELAALDLPALIRNGQRDAIDQILLKLSVSGSGPASEGAGKKDPS